ncbi:MAG: hypothetical protein OEM05_10815 [Myxococcales bacterium]|nr:hypothetical protein [Myxococcales bacterium]
MSDLLRDSQSTVARNSRRQRRERRALFFDPFHHRSVWTLVLALFLLSGLAVSAEEVSNAPMRSLDEQVQEIKSDVLSIAAELSRLEEKLLYPSDTQVAVFISLAEDEKSRLDSVRIQIDGELVAHHIYSFKELEALKRGGVQRIYTGNLPTGEHRLDVSVFGKLPSGRDFSGMETFRIEKEVGPKLIGIELAANEFGNASIEVGDQ